MYSIYIAFFVFGGPMSLTEAQQRALNQSNPANRKIGLGGIIAYLQSAVASLLEGGGAGEDGASAYVYVRYATDDSGTGFSDSPSGKTYIAVLSTDTPIENPVANDFDGLWRKFVGSDGSNGNAGSNGTNGTNAFCYVRYADNEYGEGISESPSGKNFIGIKSTSTELMNPNDAGNYTWKRFVGLNGSNGSQGNPGPNITVEVISDETLPLHCAVRPNLAAGGKYDVAKADNLAHSTGILGRNTVYQSGAFNPTTIACSYGHTFAHASYTGSEHNGKVLFLGTDGVPTTSQPNSEGNVIMVLFIVVDDLGTCVWCPQFLGIVPAS
jgi:hypothetical protein